MRPRLREIDRALAGVTLVLAGYGLATLYSAGQTDLLASPVATIWHKQLIWLVVGLVAAVLMFRVSPRLLEWATPYAYALAVVVLLLTLAVGSGGGTAAGSRSWIGIGSLRGQPAELAKLAVILMLARWLAERREPPATLRELLPPVAIVVLPLGLVAAQPDLGSAIVFVAIFFAMLFWPGPSRRCCCCSPRP